LTTPRQGRWVSPYPPPLVCRSRWCMRSTCLCRVWSGWAFAGFMHRCSPANPQTNRLSPVASSLAVSQYPRVSRPPYVDTSAWRLSVSVSQCIRRCFSWPVCSVCPVPHLRLVARRAVRHVCCGRAYTYYPRDPQAHPRSEWKGRARHHSYNPIGCCTEHYTGAVLWLSPAVAGRRLARTLWWCRACARGGSAKTRKKTGLGSNLRLTCAILLANRNCLSKKEHTSESESLHDHTSTSHRITAGT